MANYKEVKYAIQYRGLVSAYHIRIYLDNGVWYDRVFNERLDNTALHLILQGKRFAVQHLQDDNERLQEIAEAVFKGDGTKEISMDEYIDDKIPNYHNEPIF